MVGIHRVCSDAVDAFLMQDISLEIHLGMAWYSNIAVSEHRIFGCNEIVADGIIFGVNK